MKKHLLLLLVLCCSAMPIWAERIDVATARKVAQSIARQGQTSSLLRSDIQVSLVYTAKAKEDGTALRSDGAADYFVFNFPNDGGFAIISGDDCIRPVLGYSYEGSFDSDSLPHNLRGMLDSYQEQISQAVRENIEPTEEVSEEWSSFLRSAMPKTRTVTMTTAAWSQGDPYNRKTPMIGKKRTMTGCVATAMGIIMKHHEYPEAAVNPPAKNTYTVNNRKVTTAFTYGAYDWDNMLDDYTSKYNNTEADAVATLLLHCGINVEMNYGLKASGASNVLAAKALRDVFGYSPEIRYVCREAYRWKEWKAMLREELDAGYPVLYDGYDSKDKGGHAFVCDGYNEMDYYHINWGWNGAGNGYFALSLLAGYKDDQNMITHIRPETAGDTCFVRPYLASAKYTRDEDSIMVSCTMKYCALDNHEFWFGLGVADKNNVVVQAPDEEDSFSCEMEAFYGGWSLWGLDSLTTAVPATLSDSLRVTMLCSLDGQEWEVMRALDTVPLGISREEIEAEKDAGDPAANERVGADDLHVWSANGQLFIQTTTEETARIYTSDGRLYKTLRLSEGTYTKEMPHGIYIVIVGGKSFKMLF